MSRKSNTANIGSSSSIEEFIRNASDSASSGNAYSRGQGNSFSAVDVANMRWEDLMFQREASLNEEWWKERESVQGLKEQYEEAGFNPVLAATGGTAAGSSPSISTPEMETQPPTQQGQGSGGLSFISSLLGLLSPLGNLVNQSRQTSADVKNKNAETINIETDTETKKTYNKFQSRLYERSLSLTDSQIDQIRKDIDVKDVQILDYFQGINESVAREADAYASAALKNVQADQIRQLIPVYIELYQAQTEEALSQAQANVARKLLDENIISSKVYEAYAEQAKATASMNTELSSKAKIEKEVIEATKTATVVGKWIEAIGGGLTDLGEFGVDIAALLTPGASAGLKGLKKISKTSSSSKPVPSM